AYSDSDYAGPSQDKKSTTGGCQFLRCGLISWQCKEQTVVSTSSTEAERTSWNEFSSSMDSAVIYLSTGMLVAQQVDESVADLNDDDVPAAGIANEGAADVNAVLTAVDEPTIPSPTPSTQPPPSSQDQPSTSQIQPTLPQSPQAHLLSPQQQPQPSQDTDISMDLLHNLLDTCTTLTRRVENLEQDKITEAGRMIADMDADVDVTLKDITKDVALDAEIEDSADVQGRQAESQAQIYQVNLEHADKVLSMQVDEVKPTELQEVMEVVTTTKLITEVVTAASATITVVAPQLTIAAALTFTTAPSAARRRKGVLISNPKETATPSTIIHSEAKSKDKRKGILKLDEEVEELRKHLQIMPNDDDDVYTEATPLALKVPIVDYEIHIENNKPYYKIKRADGSHQLYLSFHSMLRNFDREELEVLWQLVKERFASFKPKNFSDDFLLTTLGIITFTTTQLILLIERKYLLTRFTLDQMLNNVRLKVEEESEVSLELLRFIRQHHQEVPGQVNHLVAGLTLDKERSCMMQFTSSAPGKVSNIPIVHSWGGSISSDNFLPFILLLMVIGVAVVIIVVAIVIVVVVGGESSLVIKLSFVIVGFLHRIVSQYLIH
nr:putative ribonuclease H-like domain-containing protein [Tanacetum cinerariifolium]